MSDLGADAAALRPRLRAPVGLDIGGRTPESIALSIIGEVHAALAGRAGRPFTETALKTSERRWSLRSQLLPLIAILAVSGLVAGFAAGLLGVGGGIVTVPVLEYSLRFAGVPEEYRMHVAVATSLAAIIPTSISSARSHHARGAVDWELARRWAAPMFVAAFAGQPARIARAAGRARRRVRQRRAAHRAQDAAAARSSARQRPGAARRRRRGAGRR